MLHGEIDEKHEEEGGKPEKRRGHHGVEELERDALLNVFHLVPK